MKVVNCLVITTEENVLEELKNLLPKLPFLSTMTPATSFETALECVFESEIDLIIADTRLNLIQIQSLSELLFPAIPIVIVSDNADEAIHSYEIGVAIDFILKPLRLERLMLAINRALKQKISFSGMRGRNFIFLKVGRSYQRFEINDIIFIEAYGMYVKVYTQKGMSVVNESISRIEERFSHASFIRVHKSYVINTTKISSFNANHFELPLGKIPIGPNYKQRIEGLLRMLSKVDNLDEQMV
jgi:DNA-binding LytR/AlgR family response regulator